MEFLYPPDYQYGLAYFTIILFLIIVMFAINRRIKKVEKVSKKTTIEKIALMVTLGLIILGCLYFYALPAYL